MSDVVTDQAREAYLAAADAADRHAAVHVVHELLRASADPVDVLVDVVAAGQAIIGAHWQRAACTVAEEHGATSVAEAAVAAVGASIREPSRPAGRALVACPEREWHALPARIVSEALRHHGWSTVFLGASTPASQLADYLRRQRITLVALSCSVPVALPAARRIIEAATQAGVPVLAGGRAFGPDPTRAAALGAAAWAASPRALPDVLCGLPTVPGTLPALPADRAADVAELLLRAPEFADRTARTWEAESAGCSPRNTGRLDTGHLVELAVSSLTAALLTDDVTVIGECDTWLTVLLAAHGCSTGDAGLLWSALRRTVEPQLVTAPRFLSHVGPASR